MIRIYEPDICVNRNEWKVELVDALNNMAEDKAKVVWLYPKVEYFAKALTITVYNIM